MITAIGKHMQVLLETPESIARREENPRRRKRYSVFCTCTTRRREGGHCVHTIALFHEHIKPSYRKRVTVVPLKDTDAGPPERPRIALERELVQLRAALRTVLPMARCEDCRDARPADPCVECAVYDAAEAALQEAAR